MEEEEKGREEVEDQQKNNGRERNKRRPFCEGVMDDRKKTARSYAFTMHNYPLPPNFVSISRAHFEKSNYIPVAMAWIEGRHTPEEMKLLTGYEDPPVGEVEGQHIHGWVNFSKRIVYTSKKWNKCTEELFGKRPHVKVAGKPGAWFGYMLDHHQHDTVQEYNVNIFTYVEARENRISTEEKGIVQDIHMGKVTRMEEIRDKVGGHNYLRYKRGYREEIEEYKEVSNKKHKGDIEFVAPEPLRIWGEGWYQVMCWTKMVIRKPLICRRKHLWIWGSPGTGKSTRFLNHLATRLHHWEIVKDVTQNLPYLGGYDFIYCDDYNEPYRPISYLNELTTYPQGRSIKMRQPGGTFMNKEDYPPVLIISNKRISEMYSPVKDGRIVPHRQRVIEALESRFFQVHIDRKGNPFDLSFDDEEQQRELEDVMNSFSHPTEGVSDEEKEKGEEYGEGEDEEGPRVL